MPSNRAQDLALAAGRRLLSPTAFAAALILSASAALAQSDRLWAIDAAGGNLRVLLHTPGEFCGSPDWSPDGKFIAYDTWTNGKTHTDAQIAVVRADGTNRRIIGIGAMPSWSPDGKQLVCHTYSMEGIVVMNADGSGRESIVDHWGSPRWSPRGNRIATIKSNGIALFDCTTGREETVLSGPYVVYHGFSISPDGKQFCFGNGNENGGIGLATLDERTMRAKLRWITTTGSCWTTSWSPDGKQIVLSYRPSGEKFFQLHVFDLDSGKPPVRLAGQDPERANYDPDWSPDGKTIVFRSEFD
jgi:TolB protein